MFIYNCTAMCLVSRRVSNVHAAMLDPKGRAFRCVSGSLHGTKMFLKDYREKWMALVRISLFFVAHYDLLWPFYLWFCHFISPFFAVIDSNSFGLASLVLLKPKWKNLKSSEIMTQFIWIHLGQQQELWRKMSHSAIWECTY